MGFFDFMKGNMDDGVAEKPTEESEDTEEETTTEEEGEGNAVISGNYLYMRSVDFGTWEGFFGTIEESEEEGYEVKAFLSESDDDENIRVVMRKRGVF
jgi:hypothetical protein